MRIALAQLNVVVGDLEGNVERIATAIAEARGAGADLVVLPELAVTGYPPEDLLLRPGFVRAARQAVDEVARECDGVVALVGAPAFDRDLANAAFVCSEGAVRGVYRKHFLPNYGVFDEHRYFAPGRELLLLELGDVTVGPTICEDVWQPGPPATDLALAGATLLVNLSASPYHGGKAEDREEMLVTRARDNAAYVAFCNLVGGQDELVFDGHSVVLDDEGEVIARAPGFEEALLIVDLDPTEVIGRRLRDVRRRELERSRDEIPAATVVELPDGRLVSLGGQVKPGTMANLTELYNPTTNTWTELTGLAESKPMGLYPRAILAPNGKVFVVKNAKAESAYMDVDTQKWTAVTKAPPVVAGGGMAMYESGKILLYNIGSTGTDSWVIDLNVANPSWRKVGSLQFKRKKFSTVLLPDGRVMAIGGSVDGASVISKAVLTPEIWDPATEKWTTLPNLAVPRMYHSNALLLPDGRVVTAGGGRAGPAPNFPSSQIYSPSYLSAPNRPSIAATPAVWSAGSSVNLTVSSANGVSSVVLMGLPGVTHGVDTQQRRLTLPVTSAYNPATGAISVGVPSVANAAPGHYYVIALDSRGAPTSARIVQLVRGGAGAATTAVAAEAPPADPNVPREVPDFEPQEDD